MTKLKITKPEEITSENFIVMEVVSEFEYKLARQIERNLAQQNKDIDFYYLVIEGEYNRQICDEIELIYSKAGFRKVICKTSSENGERSGVTGLQLWCVNKKQ